jgi:hypothetical protein
MDTAPASFETVDRSTFEPAGCTPLASWGRTEPLERFREAVGGSTSSEAFFEAIVGLLMAIIDPAVFYIGTLEPPGENVRTILAIRDGERVDNYLINLAGTPCSAVLGPQAMCIYTEGVADLFPRTPRLRTMGAEGYVGMSLLSQTGEKIGIVTAVTTHPIGSIDEIRAALYTFGARLSLEVERRLAAAEGRDAGEIDRAIASTEAALLRALTSAA